MFKKNKIILIVTFLFLGIFGVEYIYSAQVCSSVGNCTAPDSTQKRIDEINNQLSNPNGVDVIKLQQERTQLENEQKAQAKAETDKAAKDKAETDAENKKLNDELGEAYKTMDKQSDAEGNSESEQQANPKSKSLNTTSSDSTNSTKETANKQEQAKEANSKACKKYLASTSDKDYESYCGNINQCEVYNPTKKGYNFLKIDTIPFIPVIVPKGGSAMGSGSEIYSDFLKTLGGVGYLDNLGALEQAKKVYTETQNSIYNCSILETKIKVGKTILQYLKQQKNTNIIDKIIKMNSQVESELKKRNCNTIPNQNLKIALLDSLTYHYCNYVFYLNYLSNFPSYNLSGPSISTRVKTPAEDKKDTMEMSKYIRKQEISIQKEITHTKQVYDASFYAFGEFENTYGVHIMLTFIYDDYVQIKENLGKLLNPISQLVYKMPQCQTMSAK